MVPNFKIVSFLERKISDFFNYTLNMCFDFSKLPK